MCTFGNMIYYYLFIADLYVCIEVDSYGHYFRKARTKMICQAATPIWNEEFIIELEGSQNLRILLYEEHPSRPLLRGKSTEKVIFMYILTGAHKFSYLVALLAENISFFPERQ